MAVSEDRQAEFLKLYLGAQDSVRQLLRVLLPDRRLLDDACQAVALRLWELFESYDASRPFATWARGVASKVVLELNRAERAGRTQLSQQAIEAVNQAFDRSELASHLPNQQLWALEACLKAIPRESSELIVKRYHQSLPVEEIARQSGRTVGATFKAIERSVQSLGECVRRRLLTTTE